jgi:hypothetical protein
MFEEAPKLLKEKDLYEDEDVVIVKAEFKDDLTKEVYRCIDVGIKDLDGEIVEFKRLKKTSIEQGQDTEIQESPEVFDITDIDMTYTGSYK